MTATTACRTCGLPLVWQDTDQGRRPFNPDGTGPRATPTWQYRSDPHVTHFKVFTRQQFDEAIAKATKRGTPNPAYPKAYR